MFKKTDLSGVYKIGTVVSGGVGVLLVSLKVLEIGAPTHWGWIQVFLPFLLTASMILGYYISRAVIAYKAMFTLVQVLYTDYHNRVTAAQNFNAIQQNEDVFYGRPESDHPDDR